MSGVGSHAVRDFHRKHRPHAWIIGGGGLQLRIPLMRLLEKHGFTMSAVGPGFTEAFAEGPGV
ncbi:MAG: hypothetical protein Ct9H300mP1_26670 [Planctomycetaceae bacterium]|nr:MAG: hypothetical protein Ct9H300mP1_26670 [Planctomycetaceae bacterium]